MLLVKAKVMHTQPGTHALREEGEQFEIEGKPYKHVEEVKPSAKGKSPKADEE